MTIGNGGLAHDYPTSLTAADVGKFVTFDDAANELVLATVPATIGAGVLLGVRDVGGTVLGRVVFDGPVRILTSAVLFFGQYLTNNAVAEAIKAVGASPRLAIATGAPLAGSIPAFLLGTGATSGASFPSLGPYVVGPVPQPFQAVQPAIDQAFADGHTSTANPATVFVMPGVWVGDFAMKKGINVQGLTSNRGFTTILRGTCTVDLAPGEVRDLTHCAISDVNIQPLAGNGIDFIGITPQKLYVNNVDVELGAGICVNMTNTGVEAGVRRSQILAGDLLVVRSSGVAVECVNKAEGDLYWNRGEIRQGTSSALDAIVNKGSGLVQIANVEIRGVYRQTGATTTGVLALCSCTSTGSPIVQSGTGALTLLNVLVISGVAPAISGGAGPVFWSAITYGSAFVGFALTLNGGTGSVGGKLPIEV